MYVATWLLKPQWRVTLRLYSSIGSLSDPWMMYFTGSMYNQKAKLLTRADYSVGNHHAMFQVKTLPEQFFSQSGPTTILLSWNIFFTILEKTTCLPKNRYIGRKCRNLGRLGRFQDVIKTSCSKSDFADSKGDSFLPMYVCNFLDFTTYISPISIPQV